MRECKNQQAGFTLVELLVVIAITGVLASLSVQSYSLYKRRSYDAMTETVVNQIVASIEAGRIDVPLGSGDDWVGVWTSSEGQLPTWNGQQYFPGVYISERMQVWVERSDACESGVWGQGCLVDYIWVRHCDGNLEKSFWRSNNGLQMQSEWLSNWAC